MHFKVNDMIDGGVRCYYECILSKTVGAFTLRRIGMSSKSVAGNLAVVTLHDAAPSFSNRIFEFTDAFENLGINFNLAVVPFFHHEEDLPRFPEFVE